MNKKVALFGKENSTKRKRMLNSQQKHVVSIDELFTFKNGEVDSDTVQGFKLLAKKKCFKDVFSTHTLIEIINTRPTQLVISMESRTSPGLAKSWVLHKWTKKLVQEDVEVKHSVIYLKHTSSGNIITSQHKAWNDTVRMAMYIELILKPYAEKQPNKKVFLWQDNCGLHKVKCLDETYEECNVEVGYLPVNTTYMLQVLDLVVNGPLKACIRKHRAQSIVEYFAKFKALYDMELSKPQSQRITPLWKPPKPELAPCILNLIKLISSTEKDGFCHADFVKGVKRSFIAVGLAYKEGTKIFEEYSDTTKSGTMEKPPAGTQIKFEHAEVEFIYNDNANEEEEEEEEE
jgi:hypothetical protein